MFCSNCATQLPDEADFCWKCGKPQKQAAEEPKWETCEVKLAADQKGRMNWWNGSSRYRWQFWAEAIGLKGRYNAGESEYLTALDDEVGPQNPKVVKLMDSVIDKLLKDGWEPLPRGEKWFSYRFRRRAK